MEIRVLGPLEVITADDAPPLRLGGPQPRAVLGILALRAGAMVPVPTLVQALWPAEVPRSATSVVHTYMSRLRRTLTAGDPAPVGLVRRATGYVLEAGPAQVDALRFECRVAEARAQAALGDIAAAATTYREALDLWRGEVLADLPGLMEVRRDASRLDQMRLTALENRLDAELALGRHAAVVAELTGLTDSHPFRERFWAQLMVALYRSGRQTEALAAYRRVRSLLVDQFGIEPGPELQALERGVLHQDVGPGPAPAPPAGAGPGPARVPLPTALAHPAHDRPLAGRERERAALEDVLDVARSGHLATVFVGGPPGIGKTALAAWWARRAHAAGATVVMGRADEASPAPFRPLGEAIGHWAQHRPPDGRLHRLDERDLRLLSRIVPRLRPPGTPAPPAGTGGDDQDRLRLFDATARWVEELAAAAAAEGAPPPVVLLDDLQWADVTTLLAVRHLLRHPPDAGALLVVTHRDVDLAEGHGLLDLLAGIQGDAPARRLAVPGLDARDVVTMLGALAPGPDAAVTAGELASELVRVTGGNPLFVHETIRYLGERGDLTSCVDPHTGTLRLDRMGVPDGVKEVIERRLRRLPAGTTAVLRRAAVLGDQVDRPVLAHLVGQPELALVEALEPAVAARLLVADGNRWSFAHGLVREAIVDGLGLAERARTHWRAGLLLQELGAQRPGTDLAGIARHLTSGVSAGDAVTAVAANVRAGEAALGTMAFEEALDDFERAVDLLVRGDEADPDLLYRAWKGLGLAGGMLADRRRQREGFLRAAEVARAHGWAEQLTDAVTGFVAYVGTAGSTTGAVEPADHERDEALADELLHHALAIVGPEPSVNRCTLLAIATVRAMTADRAGEARAAADEVMVAARALGQPATTAHAQVTYLWSRLGTPSGPSLGDAPRRLLDFDWEPEQRVSLRVFTLPVLPTTALQRGDRLVYEAIRAGVADDPETWRSAHLQSYLRMWEGATALADGRFDEALRLASAPVRGAQGWGAWATAAMVQRIVAAVEIGDPTAGPRLEMFLGASARPRTAPGLAMAAHLAAAAGDAARAAGHIREVRERPFDELGWAAPIVLRHLAEAAAWLGDDPLAADLAADLLPVATGYDGQMLVSFTATTIDGAGARVVGQLLLALGRAAEAVDRLAAGRALEQAFGGHALAARTSFWLARALLARGGPGDAGEARAVAEATLPQADRLGMSLLGRDLRGLLRSLGGGG